MPGLILEGIVGAGKTCVYEHLLTDRRFRARPASLALPEAYTERAFEHLPARGPAEALALVERILTSLESLNGLQADGKFRAEPGLAFAWLLERFHLSHALMTTGGDGAPFAAADRRLATLGGRLAVLVVPESAIADRLTRTRAQRPESWKWYLDHIVAGREPGMSEHEVMDRLVAHYAAQQRRLMALATTSAMPVTVVETAREDWEACAEHLLEAWGL